ncbi:hypothetical protein [Ensifer sp. MJa1]|uniref:hypothetical protein n=1 Tax=Ensifer sp. MJa1 TaxID=2919888 RepID=UPI003FA5A4C8
MSEAALPNARSVPQSLEELKLRIVERRIALPTSPKLAMHRILSQPGIVAFGTVESVAAACGVSGTTIVRFCSKIGYKNVREMRRIFQEHVAVAARGWS